MSTVAEFVTDTHTRVRGQKMPNVSIGIASATAIVGRVDPERMAAIANATIDYLPQVRAELDELRRAVQRHPGRMARRLFLFGITTPNRSEDQSIAYALAAEPFYGILSAEDLARITFTVPSGKQGKAGFYVSLERSISDGAAALGEHPDIEDLLNVPLMETLRGVGPKVARMMAAVAGPWAGYWTVDLWHARQLLWAAGMPSAVRVSVEPSAYRTLENVWLDYKARYFAQEDTFAVQWATWCAAQGEFISHRALWQDLA